MVCSPVNATPFVLASKYSLGSGPRPSVATTGNSRKTLVQSVEASLRRLNTDRIDLYWVHMDDGITASEEIVRGLDDVVRAGKVIYVGFSDFAAWRVARAATIAELRGWAPVIGIQTEYSLVERTSDRELIPMAQAMGLGIASWSPLGGGLLTGKYRRGEPGRATTFGAIVHREDSPRITAILDALTIVAEETNASLSQVALAWQCARGIVPIVGPRTVDQLDDNLGASAVTLTGDQLGRLGAASAVPLGFPHDFLADPMQFNTLAGGNPDAIIWPDQPAP